MQILSVQSAVTYGHVGNSAAIFALRRLGHEAWPIDTVTFSNHPGHGGFRGRVTPATEISALIEGLAERGVLGGIDALLTGYLGDASHGPVIETAAAAVKRANSRALWVLDPVSGDRSPQSGARVYVRPGIPEFFRRAVTLADIATPNAFELELLTGAEVHSTPQAIAAARRLGPGLVIVKSVRDRPGTLATLAVTAADAWRVETPELPLPGFGAGDTFAAMFVGRFLATRDVPGALSAAVSAIHAILAATGGGRRDLALVAAQDQIVSPAPRFAALPA